MASELSLVATKQALRKRMRSSASAPWSRDPEARGRADAAITAWLVDSAHWTRASAIVVFMSVRHEVRTQAILERARATGKDTYLPCIRGEVGEGRMTMHRVGSDDELVPGIFGLLEPAPQLPADLVERAEEVLLLIPGLAFTREGGRLGQGGGFYDRFLARLGEHAGARPIVALAYEWQILDELPVAAHDQRVDFLCTETGVRACSPDT